MNEKWKKIKNIIDYFYVNIFKRTSKYYRLLWNVKQRDRRINTTSLLIIKRQTMTFPLTRI